jgi:hypothetical protein
MRLVTKEHEVWGGLMWMLYDMRLISREVFIAWDWGRSDDV